jgi:hypothetical protein
MFFIRFGDDNGIEVDVDVFAPDSMDFWESNGGMLGNR